MKKLLLILLICCSHAVFAQNNKTSPDVTGGEIPTCPVGTCPMATINIDVFNFHKPRTNCTSGFGVCLRFSWGISCVSCYYKGSVAGDKLTAYAKLSNAVAELHVPVGLKDAKGFEKTDMSTFEVEDKSLSFKTSTGVEKFVRGGIYPVVVSGDEYVIKLNLY